jgi:TonB family protein
VLDDALLSLSARDRDAILLRFFSAQGFAAIGASFHVSENAARMRVERALDKLRVQLARRGIASTLAALGVALSAHGAIAPPATLAGTITTSALAGASGAGATVACFNLLAMTKIQLGLTAAVVAIGVTTLALEQREQTELRAALAHTAALADESAQLQAKINTLEQTIRHTQAMRASAAELAATRRATRELQEQRALLDTRLNPVAPPATNGPPTPPSSTAPAQLDQMPRTITRVSPVYPFNLKKAGIPGEVLVAFTVDAQGKVQDPVVVETTHPDFSAPALQAIQHWRFAPGKKGGRVVNSRLQAPIVFEVQDPNWF